MIEFISSWAKSLGVTIVLVSIFEMLLPNNKTKKYIRMVLGIFVIFTIISPFIKNKDKLNLNNIDFENYVSIETANVNQTSMNDRIKDLYEEELEKDITKKVEEQGYKVKTCKVVATIVEEENEETQINEIKLTIEKNINEEEKETKNLENKIVTEIQEIKKVDTSVKIDNEENTDETEKTENMRRR